jgi:hypothetical protein
VSPRHPARSARQARMGSTYRLDPLRSEELGELT